MNSNVPQKLYVLSDAIDTAMDEQQKLKSSLQNLKVNAKEHLQPPQIALQMEIGRAHV